MSEPAGQTVGGVSAPIVSVVIPAFNSAEYLREAIQSVLAQTHTGLQVLVIDDGSTDGTADVAKGFGQSVSYVRQDNAGACAARNHGIRLAEGAYVAFLDADDIWVPDKIAKQVAFLENHPDFGAVHCDSSRMNEAGRLLTAEPTGKKQNHDGDVFMEFFEANLSVILTSTVIVRHSCFDEIGVFDGGGEVVDDHDFFLRLAARYPVGYIHEPLMQYRILAGSLSRLQAVRRVDQHAATLRRAISTNLPRFEHLPTRYLRRRWLCFHSWAGMMLYYQGERRAARIHLMRALPGAPAVLPHLLLCLLPWTRKSQSTADASQGRM